MVRAGLSLIFLKKKKKSVIVYFSRFFVINGMAGTPELEVGGILTVFDNLDLCFGYFAFSFILI